MQIDSILNEFVDVALEVEAKMTVTQAEVFKTADIVGRKEVSYIVGGIKDKRLQKIHVADAFPLDYILEKNGGKDIAKVFENNLLLLRQIRQIGQSSEGEVVA